ncbi:hypothetical protein [Lentzea jiangxiensis]|uniref:DUF3618 domain-containing protein n=1 Tax=Lentzea jiangxiensis TaxID=641025 RepID=A0A1H0JXT9_9PSEU|nr:hypothetical protein [Lentzea jiangxiensis]SDO48332.1 hypothetical protein SAMN05421507_102677 [Lentzea jiangxiensis]
MSDKNVPADAGELRAETAQTRWELGDSAPVPAPQRNVPGPVKPGVQAGAEPKQNDTRAGKPAPAAAGPATGAAGKTGEKPDQPAAAEATGVAREKVTAAAAQAGEKATQVGQKASAVAGQVTAAAAQVGGKAGAVAGQVGEKATAIAGQLGEKADVVATQVGVTALEAVDALPEPVRQRVEQGVRQARQHPAVVAAGVATAVLLLWKLLRRGR